MMESSAFTKAFEALAHETRLAVFRMLIPAGREGRSAGTIGEELGLPANSLSFHFGRLVNAGLIHSRRQGRHLYYALDYERLAELVGFLTDDCCAAVPEGCLPECPGSASTSGRGCRAARKHSRTTERQKGVDDEAS